MADNIGAQQSVDTVTAHRRTRCTGQILSPYSRNPLYTKGNNDLVSKYQQLDADDGVLLR